MDKISNLFRYKILPIYWAFLTFMLLRPAEANRAKSWLEQEFVHLDKIAHFSIFVILGFCYCMAFPKQKRWLFWLVMSVYAAFTEITQGLMDAGRTMEFYDFVADMLGTLLGFLVWSKSIDFFKG